MKKILQLSIVSLIATVCCWNTVAQQDISPAAIAVNISLDSGRPAEDYTVYSTNLATTLGYLSIPQLQRVFQGPVSQNLPTTPTVNEQLDLESINFEPKSSILTAAAKSELDKVVEFLNENPDLQIRIEGHINFKKYLETSVLSQGRADASMLYLLEQGIDPDRVEAVSKGSSEPILDENGEPVTGEANRRIEIEIVE